VSDDNVAVGRTKGGMEAEAGDREELGDRDGEGTIVLRVNMGNLL